MPKFRELWGWVLFVVLSITSLVLVCYRESTERTDDSLVGTVLAIGQSIAPLLFAVAIGVYTVTEGVPMIAESFKRKMKEWGRQEGREEVAQAVRRQMEERGLSAITQEEFERILKEELGLEHNHPTGRR